LGKTGLEYWLNANHLCNNFGKFQSFDHGALRYFPIDPNNGFCYFGTVIVLRVFEPSNNLTSPFWRIFELDFPERSNVQAPGDSDFPFGAFFILE
jgi:hypothetical protein